MIEANSANSCNDSSLMHPFNVYPSANKLLRGSITSNKNNGSFSGIISKDDSILLEILTYVDAESMSVIMRCNRTLYVYGCSDSLWRDLVLLSSGGKGIKFTKTWQDTYIKSIVQSHHYTPQKSLRFQRTSKNYVVESEFAVYSDALYKPWVCARIDYDKQCPGFFTHEDIPRVDSREFSVQQFVGEFETPHRPVIITHVLDEWHASAAWQDPQYMIECCSDQKRLFRATSAATSIPALFTMQDYWQYTEECGRRHPLSMEEAPLYLFERGFCNIEALRKDYEVPKYFSAEERSDGDMFRLLGEQARPDHRWLIVGPRRSGSLFHIDPNATHAWNACIKGKKKWIFYPPGVHPPGVQSSADGAEVVVPISTAEWLLSFWSYHLQARQDTDPRRRPLECIQNAGELVFVPRGYWHMVVNLEDNVAVTQNYLAASNLKACFKFLRYTPEQISGLRGEVIKPEDVLDTITARIREHIDDQLVQQLLSEDDREHKDYIERQRENKRLCSALGGGASKARKVSRCRPSDDCLSYESNHGSATDDEAIDDGIAECDATSFTFSFSLAAEHQ